MTFQSSGFQPEPKPSLRTRLGRAAYAFVVPAEGLPLLEESAWQRGKRRASELANRQAIRFMIICAPIFAVGGLFFALPGWWWPLRVLIAALIGLCVAGAAAFLISGCFALRAPYKQREEARDYARALEAHAHDYAEWARRREIAYEFRHAILEDARRLDDEKGVMVSVDYEETRWRSNVAAIRSQMQEHGADASVLGLLDTQWKRSTQKRMDMATTSSVGSETAWQRPARTFGRR